MMNLLMLAQDPQSGYENEKVTSGYSLLHCNHRQRPQNRSKRGSRSQMDSSAVMKQLVSQP